MIELLFLTSFWIWGVFTLFHKGFLLARVGDFFCNKVGNEICKPIFACPPCMASIHGTIFYIYFLPNGGFDNWVVFCVALVGINFIIKEFLYE